VYAFRNGQSRKVAFIGFASSAEAAHAKKYFHNTYIDTAKIYIEYALPVSI